MKWTSWAFLAFLGSLAFLVLFIADHEMNAGVDRLSSGPNLTLRFALGFLEGLACASLGDARANEHPIEPSGP